MSETGSRAETDWRIIGEREGVSRVDTWDEFLCLCHEDRGWFVSVCSYKPLAVFPCEWFDDDGQPMAPYADEDGCLLPPVRFEGQAVTGHGGGYLLGELSPINDYASLRLISDGPEEVASALREIGWDEADTPKVLEATHR